MMELSDRLKKQVHGVSNKEHLCRQGQTKWMQAPSEHPKDNPFTPKGKKIMKQMRKQYGKKAEKVFYASKNKGTIKGVDR